MPQFAATSILLDVDAIASTGTLYDDLPPALLRWNANGLDVRTYSSQSIAEQRMFFRDTEYGDLLKFFGGLFDATSGSKQQLASYVAIAEAIALELDEILFLSDDVSALNAARKAGMETCLCRRPDNPPVEPGHGHVVVSNFAQLELV